MQLLDGFILPQFFNLVFLCVLKFIEHLPFELSGIKMYSLPQFFSLRLPDSYFLEGCLRLDGFDFVDVVFVLLKVFIIFLHQDSLVPCLLSYVVFLSARQDYVEIIKLLENFLVNFGLNPAGFEEQVL